MRTGLVGWDILKETANGLEVGTRRVSLALRRYPLVLVLPLFCSNAIYRFISFGLHRVLGRKHAVVESLLLFAVSFPLGTIAEAVVARMFLVFRQQRRPSAAQVGEVLKMPGLTPLLVRLIGLLTAWMLLAFVLAAVPLLLASVGKAVAFSIAHHGAKMPPTHGGVFGYLITFAVLFGILVSRYSFVLPLLAAENRGSKEFFRMAVQRAKAHLLPLRVVNVLEYVLATSIAQFLRPLEQGWSLRAAVVLVLGLVVTSSINTWFELLKAELAFSV